MNSWIFPLISTIFSLFIPVNLLSDLSITLAFLSFLFSQNYFEIVVSMISFIVFIYSKDYIRKNLRRYWFFMNLFLFSMLLFIKSKNLLISLLCWEITSFCSWGLISFDFLNPKARKEARKAFLIVSIADSFLFLSIFLLFMKGGSWSFEIFQKMDDITSLLFLIGIIGKGSIFPFYWLKNAMIAPSTVSALLHSSTMVKIGLIFLFKVFCFLTPTTKKISYYIGVLSCTVLSFLSLFERNYKKFFAYSTAIHLSILLILVGNPFFFKIHFLSHALFKSYFFLLYPLVRRKNMYKAKFPKTLWTMFPLINFLGIPPSPIFISKSFLPLFAKVLVYLYSFKFFVIFLTREKVDVRIKNFMKTSLISLSILSIYPFLFFKFEPSEIVPLLIAFPISFFFRKEIKFKFEFKFKVFIRRIWVGKKSTVIFGVMICLLLLLDLLFVK